MRRFRFLRRPRWLVTLIVAIALALQILVSAQAAPLPTTPAIASARSASLIPIQQQPFYGELERTAGDWSDVVLDQVVGNSPRETLLNFYAVMAEVGQRAERLAQPRSGQEGSRAAKERREKIEDADLLFHLAVEALDASAFPESVRVDRAEEAAIQLKHVLDYVFTHSRQPIAIPDEADMKMLQESRTNQSDSWSIPGTSITLTSPSDSELGSDHYRFSPATVVAVGEMYREIRDYPVIPQPFATPEFLNNFIFTPGYLVPPDWYLSLPHSLRHVLGYRIGNQTLLQVVSSLIACALFVAVLGWLIGLLVDSYRDRPRREQEGRSWQLDVLAWQRVLILLPLLPLTRLVKTFVDDVVNLTGAPLVVVTYIFFVIWYVSAGFFAFYFAEAVGRSSAELLLRLRGGGSSLQLQRITNLVMPITRAIGALASIALLYRLLIVLGLPANTGLFQAWLLVLELPRCWAIPLPVYRSRPTDRCGSVSSIGWETIWATSPRSACAPWSSRPLKAGSPFPIPWPKRPRLRIIHVVVFAVINRLSRHLSCACSWMVPFHRSSWRNCCVRVDASWPGWPS